MRANSLVTLDREHLVHPVSAYRAHEAQGVTVLTERQGHVRAGRLGQGTA